VALLVHRLFSRFDSAVRQLGLFKMDTVGDAYFAAGFLPPAAAQDGFGSNEEEEQHLGEVCGKMLQLAAAILAKMRECRRETGVDVHARVGLAVGPVVVGVLGRLQPRVHMLGQVCSFTCTCVFIHLQVCYTACICYRTGWLFR
jgi:class 3 adenylate cyclase